jgi:uncharacterized SAM-binding protein YcdF (DUF218 family)
MRGVIEYGFLAPPTVFIEFCLLGAAIALVWRRTGVLVALSGSLCLFVVATPAFSSCLLVWLESNIPKDIDLSAAQAIVILGSDLRANDTATPESLGPQTLERLFFAADAYRQLRLPIAVSGGPISNSGTPIAEMMRSALERYFAIPVTWTESESRTTYENAVFTTRLLQKINVRTVIVVTQARDEPRAIWSFERAGLVALPWTSPRAKLKIRRISDFLPNISSLEESYYTFHELIGAIYYRLRY